MLVYADSSALVKRAVQEPESDALDATLHRSFARGDVVISSSLAWVEVSRALRTRSDGGAFGEDTVHDAVEGALSGVAERLITGEVTALARRLAPTRLRTLDAIHLATAILLDADQVVVYDDRLLEACRLNGLTTVTPRPSLPAGA